MASLSQRNVIFYRPSRVAFAVTSGSWTHRPALKGRPCLVVESDPEIDEVILKPLLGACYVPHAGDWFAPEGTYIEYWHPVRIYGAFQAPVDPLERETIKMSYIRPARQVSFQPKRSYIWTGDRGELVEGLNMSNVALNPWLEISQQEMDRFIGLENAQTYKPMRH